MATVSTESENTWVVEIWYHGRWVIIAAEQEWEAAKALQGFCRRGMVVSRIADRPDERALLVAGVL